MEEGNRATITALRYALENKQWAAVKKLLSSVQPNLPSQATGTEIARALEIVREAADAFAETCSFTTAFETAYNSRRALLGAGVCEWAVTTLDTFRVFVPVIERVATVIGLLGTGVEERCHVGASGAVDLLSTLWHNNPRCLEIVSALGSLCAGHIDNVSRTMRQRGLVVAMGILRETDCLDNHQLVERTLLYIGVCAICIPDNQEEGTAMVPVLLDILERLTEAGMLQAAEHAISAFGNISDCWMKEDCGYAIADHERLITAIVKAWSAFARSRSIASAASRTLLAFFSSHNAARVAILEKSVTLSELVQGCRLKTTSLLALRDVIDRSEVPVSSEDEPMDVQMTSPEIIASVSPEDETADDEPPIIRRPRRQRVTRQRAISHLVRETSSRSPKTPTRLCKLPLAITKRREVHLEASRNTVSVSSDEETTSARATPTGAIRRGPRSKRSPRTPRKPSSGAAMVAQIEEPEVIDLCSGTDEDTYSPVTVRALDMDVALTPSRTRRRRCRK